MEIEQVPVADTFMDIKRYNGIRFPKQFTGNVTDHLKYLNTMVCRDDDVFLMAYPKCVPRFLSYFGKITKRFLDTITGSHFLREVINMIQKGKAEYISSDETDAPIGNMTTEQIENMKSPRLLYQHMPFEYLPKSYRTRKGKVIALIRNPKDTCTSFYHFFQRLLCKLEWKEFYQLFMDGALPYGRWFDWVKALDRTLQENPDYPFLTLFYEDVKKDLKGQIRRISDFLEVACDDQLVGEIAEKCEFNAMREGKSKSIPSNVKTLSLDGKDPFLRKGAVGDWKNLFTVADNERMDAEYKQEMKNTNLILPDFLQQ